MLPTCRRCQKRKIRCDQGLPACSPCASMGLECAFNDAASGEAVPRSYIARLDESVRQLKAEVLRLQRSENGTATVSSSDSSTLELPAETYIDGDLSNPYLMSFFKTGPTSWPTFLGAGSACSYMLAAVHGSTGFFDGNGGSSSALEPPLIPSCFPNMAKVDRALVTVADIRELIDRHYIPIVHRRYPFLEVKQLAVEMPLKRLPIRQRFSVIMAAAIGGAHAARNYPMIQTTASVLRHWADELAEPMLAEQNMVALKVLLLLILYELVDPSRGLCWRLFAMAGRLCVNLNWHRDFEDEDHQDRQSRQVTFLALYELERHVCSVLGRPAMLRDQTARVCAPPPSTPEHTRFISQQKQWRLHEIIFESPSPAPQPDCPSCLITDELVSLVHQLDDSPDCDMAWLQLQALRGHMCTKCLTYERWDREITRAAISIIENMQEFHRKRHIISVWLATGNIVLASSALVAPPSTQWLAQEGQDHLQESDHGKRLRALSICSSLLTAFAENWAPAALYRDVMERLISISKRPLDG